MEISKSLEQAALDAIQQSGEQAAEAPIPVPETPFVVSSELDGLLPHGVVNHEGKPYYVGIPEKKDE